MTPKHAVMYRCFVIGGNLKNHYTELLFERSIDEDIIEKIALSKLNLTHGSLHHQIEEVMETNRYGQLYTQSLFVTLGLGDDMETVILDTSLKISNESYHKIVEAIEWITSSNCFISAISSLGHTDFLRKSNVNNILKPLTANYLSLRILSAVQKHEFTDNETLADAIKGGSTSDQSLKTECIEYLQETGLMHKINDFLRPTELGLATLGNFEAPLDLDAKPASTKTEKEKVPPKEYANSGIEGLTPTGEHIMGIMAAERQLTKARLKKILKANEIYNLYGVISKTMDLLVKKGLLTKENIDVKFKDMKDTDIVILVEQGSSDFDSIRKDPATFIQQILMANDALEHKTPDHKRIARTRAIVKAMLELGIEITTLDAAESIRNPSHILGFI